MSGGGGGGSLQSSPIGRKGDCCSVLQACSVVYRESFKVQGNLSIHYPAECGYCGNAMMSKVGPNENELHKVAKLPTSYNLGDAYHNLQ